MNKKITIMFLAVAMIFATLVGGLEAFAVSNMQEKPQLMIDGNIVNFREGLGTPFVDANYRTQVPLRGAMEAFGAEVSWDQNAAQAVISKGGITVIVPLWASYILKDGMRINNDTMSVAIQERIYLPIRAVLEAFGATVSYDYVKRTVVVSSNDNGKTSQGSAQNINIANKANIGRLQPGTNTEMKAMWISYLEFQNMPKSKNAFQASVDKMFDDIKSMKMNSVIVQVRPFADAMYPSKYFPWSKYAGGVTGVNPGYDPTEYMVKAAHDRGLEFHAWINPYRIGSNVGGSIMSDPRYADWESRRLIIKHNSSYYFNPASVEARNLIISGVKEIIESYPVEGIHFDDYFYPSLGGGSFDQTEYEQSGSNLSLAAWRRENVSALVSGCYSVVKATNPNVVFGISPAGNIDNLKSSSSHFVDIDRWMSQSGYVDYIMPQLYWGFEAKNSRGNIAGWAYENNLSRWIGLKNKGNVKLYVGLSLSYAGKPTRDGNSVSEWLRYNDIVSRQVMHARGTGSVSGFAFFRYDIFKDSLASKEVTNLISII